MLMQLILLLYQIVRQLIVNVGKEIRNCRFFIVSTLSQGINHLLPYGFSVIFLIYFQQFILFHVGCESPDWVVQFSPWLFFRLRSVKIRIV